jgi:hypothetical protein
VGTVAGLLLTFDLVLALFCAGAAKVYGHRLPMLGGSAAPVAATARPAGDVPPAPIRIKRRDTRSAEELSRQLLAVPELDLGAEPETGASILAAARPGGSRFTEPILEPLLKRADLQGLPMALGADCRLEGQSSRIMDFMATELRLHLLGCMQDGVPNVPLLRQRLQVKGGQLEPEVNALLLVQMLQVEEQPIRLLLVELLADTPGRRASAALAGRALFDLAPEVREAAVRALADRPRPEFRQVLLDGLRYPWAPVADHAAEALVALDDRQSLPQLTRLCDEPDPSRSARRAFHDIDPALLTSPSSWPERLRLPTAVVLDESEGGEPRTTVLAYPKGTSKQVLELRRSVDVVREVVRVNHLRNCLLCHPPSLDGNDPVRGMVPRPDQSLPPFSPSQYEGRDGNFVRADVTYLRQDFSLPQPVDSPGKWPAHQRYDYLVRTRYATHKELRREPPATYPQRESVRWALRELGGAPRANE